MILVISHRQDFTADFVIDQFNERKIPYRRLNCEDILKGDISISFASSFQYSLLGQSEFHSIWFRRTKLPTLGQLTASNRTYIQFELYQLLQNLFSILPGRWLSDPKSVYSAENKLLQLKVAQKIGFIVPATLLTTSHSEFHIFYRRHNKKVIAKPISQTRLANDDEGRFIFTSLIPVDMAERIEEFDLTPCLFQEYVPKDYEIRVTVVGDKVFAARVDSQADPETLIDWRRKKLSFEACELPRLVADKCRQITRELDLGFGAIDMIKTVGGEYVFLEINPNGQWAWIEAQTHLPISEAIIDYLEEQPG